MPARARTRCAAAACAALALLAAPGVLAQAPEAAAPATAGPPLPIPGPEITDRAQAEEQALREIRSRAEPVAAVVEIETALVVSAEQVAELAGRERERLAGQPSRRELARAEFDFESARTRLDRWSETLAKRASALDRDLALLDDHQKAWEATREKAAAERESRALLERVDATLAAIARTARSVRSRREHVLTLRENVGRQQSTVGSLLELVSDKRQERRRSLWAIEAPPLWRAFESGPVPAPGMLERMRVAREHDVDDLTRWFEEGSERLVLLGLLCASVVLVALRLRLPVARLAERDERLVPYARILDRPVAAGLVAALFVGAFLVSGAPPAVLAIHGFALTLAVVRLLVPLIETDLQRVLYGLTAWYALDRLRDRLAVDAVANRMVLLFAALLVVASVLWMQRPSRVAGLRELARRPGWLRAVSLGLRVALAASLASVASNLVGNVTLAELLVEGTVATAWLAFLFYGGSRVLIAAWALLLRSGAARSLRMVRNHESLLMRRGRAAIHVALVLGWAAYSLAAFDVFEPARDALATALGAQASLGELSLSLGGVLGFFAMVWLSVLASRFVRFALEEDVLPRASLPRGVGFAISTLARYAILLVGFAMAVLAAGLDLTKLTLVLGALGVGVGIGLQDVVNNFVSGLILLFERPVQVGDLVNVGDVMGEVRRIGMRSSTVRRFDGAEVVIPNSKLVSESFVNWTLSDRLRRIELPVGVAYGSDPERVLAILDAAVKGRPEFLSQPPPLILFQRFGESSLDFVVRAWTDDVDRFPVHQSALAVDIYRALRAAGVEIPFPQRDLHLRSLAPGLEGVLRSAEAALPVGAPRRSADPPGEPG